MKNVLFAAALSGLVTLIGMTHAQASTMRYTFDVVEVELGFQTHAIVPRNTSPYYDDFFEIGHPLSDLRDQTFEMSIDITDLSAEFPELQRDYGSATDIYSTISCVSGPFCENGTGQFRSDQSNVHPHEGLASFGDIVRFGGSLSNPNYRISFFYNSFRNSGIFGLATDVDDFAQSIVLGGRTYSAQGPTIQLTLANVSINGRSITPIPLPASALLLGAGLIPMVVLRRRKNRA